MLPPCLLIDWFEHFPGHQETADEVGAQHGFEAFLIDRSQRRWVLAAGIVDQSMDRPVLGDQLFDQLLHRFFIADIAGLPVGTATVLGDFSGDLFQLFRFAPDQQHIGTEGCQFMGGAAPDTAAATGNDDGLAAEQIGVENRRVSHANHPLVELFGDALRHRDLDFQQLLGEGFALRIDAQAGHTTTAEGVFQ
jgi:hypothetical protein